MTHIQKKRKRSTVITHSTVHGHIHTYEGDHRHIHGHIHKHQHTLPPNIDASSLIVPLSKSEGYDPLLSSNEAVMPSPPSPSPTLSTSNEEQINTTELNELLSFGLSHCQIQQIIDQCCQNGFGNCFDCTETETAIANNGLYHSHASSTSPDYHDIVATLPSSTQDSVLTNAEGSPKEIKSQLQSIIDLEESCIDPFCIGNETVQQGDKCFEFCDFENFTDDIKTEKDDILQELITDLPISYNPLGTLSSSSKLSDIRSGLENNHSNNKHKHIHGHDILHHCLNDLRPPEPHLCDKKRRPGKVEQFHYNWINLNDASVKKPKLITQISSDMQKHKEHLHCLWSECSSNLAKYHSNKELQSHVLQDHLMSNTISTPDSETDCVVPNDQLRYECEWLDCNFCSDDVMKFLEHISIDHGFKEPQLISNTAETDELAKFDHKRHERSNDHDYSHLEQRSSLCKEEIDEEVDLDHTCKWETENGVFCERKFSSTQDLTNHLIDFHIGGGQTTYICQWENCSRIHKLFNQRQKIIRHLHVHTKHRPCVCKICGKKFSFDLMVEQHMRTHTGEKPYQCSVCAKWFKTSSSLSIHLRIHSGEKPLICKYSGCGKRFNESSNLTKHYKIHQRRLKCHSCIKTFNFEEQLLRHLKISHGIHDLVEIENLKIRYNAFENPDFNQSEDSTKAQEFGDESCSE